MGYGIRDGDIISLSNPKAGALTLSVPFWDYSPRGTLDPYDLWATQPAVRTVIGFIARTVASVPFHVYQGDNQGGKVIDAAHPLNRALHRPWPKQGQGRFIEALILDMYIYGRWAFLAMPDGEGGYEFPKLKANRFSMVVDGFGRFKQAAIHAADGSGIDTVPLEHVVFDLGPEPLFGEHRTGSTSVTTLEDLARELTAMGEYREDLFKNSARVPAVIERPKDAGRWSDASFDRFKREFSTYRAGGGNAGGTPILEDGMTYKPVSTVSPKEAQYIDVRKLALEEAAQALHVPPELVGAREGTYSNIVALREQLYQDVLGPLIKWTQEAMNVGLEHLLGPGEEIRADVDSKLRTDWATRAKIYQTSVGAPILTVNEARAREGMPAQEGGDTLITPLNVTKGGLASPTDTGQTNEPDPADPLPAIGGKARPATVAKADGTDAGDAEDTKSFADGDSDALQQAITALEGAAVKAVEEIVAGLSERLGVGRKAPSDLEAALGQAYMVKDEKLIAQILAEYLPDVAAESSLQTFAQMGAEVGAWQAESQYSWLSKAGQTYARVLVEERFYKRIEEVIFADDSDTQIRAVLDDAGNQAKKWVTGTVTEVVSFGAKDAAEEAKATHKTWLTTSAHPRDTHAELNGLTIPIEHEFPNGLRWPGDWTGRGPETANCKCRLRYEKLF
ncbi:phage portal protein [Rothia sp. LK2588]|uniref:phage portal protein n=1 Tax=Rothia sp. LK2588 TaxID=3114369 RepID=UPI0034CEBDF4